MLIEEPLGSMALLKEEPTFLEAEARRRDFLNRINRFADRQIKSEHLGCGKLTRRANHQIPV
jgi:hypothetical protein